MYICIYVYMYICIYVYIYIYAGVFTCRGLFYRVCHFWLFWVIFVFLGPWRQPEREKREKEREREREREEREEEKKRKKWKKKKGRKINILMKVFLGEKGQNPLKLQGKPFLVSGLSYLSLDSGCFCLTSVLIFYLFFFCPSSVFLLSWFRFLDSGLFCLDSACLTSVLQWTNGNPWN